MDLEKAESDEPALAVTAGRHCPTVYLDGSLDTRPMLTPIFVGLRRRRVGPYVGTHSAIAVSTGLLNVTHGNLGPGFIIPSIFGHKRTRNRLR